MAVALHEPLQFGAALRARREALRLQQREVAARAGISSSLLSLLEQNKRQPSLGTLDALAEALGVTVWYLVAESQPISEHASERTRQLCADLRELSRKLQELLDRSRESAEEAAD